MSVVAGTARRRQRAAVACCVALALGAGLGLGLIVREGRRPVPAHDGKPERQLLIEIERIHTTASDEARGLPVSRRASAEEPALLAHIRAISGTVHSDLSSLEAEAIRFTHSLDRVAAGTNSPAERDDLVAELDARRDGLEGEVQRLMSSERASLRAERADAIASVGRLRIVLAFASVLGLIGGILLAVLAWMPTPVRRPPIDVIATAVKPPENQPELLH